MRKLKDFILLEQTQSNYRELAIDTLVKCIRNLPHKVMLYAALVTHIHNSSAEGSEMAREIV